MDKTSSNVWTCWLASDPISKLKLEMAHDRSITEVVEAFASDLIDNYGVPILELDGATVIVSGLFYHEVEYRLELSTYLCAVKRATDDDYV